MSRIDELLLTLPDEDLPKLARELAAIGIDRQSILRLCGKYGGRVLYVSDCSELTELLGEKNARRLDARYHGETIEVPSLFRFRGKARALAIREAREARVSVADCARQHGISMRRVRAIANALPAQRDIPDSTPGD